MAFRGLASGFMKLQQILAISCFFCFIWIQPIICDQISKTSVIRWSCTCTSASEVSVSILIVSNCSTSCDCQPFFLWLPRSPVGTGFSIKLSPQQCYISYSMRLKSFLIQ